MAVGHEGLEPSSTGYEPDAFTLKLMAHITSREELHLVLPYSSWLVLALVDFASISVVPL